MEFFGTYGGHLCGFGGFLTAIAALLYARARVAEFEQSVRDLDWQPDRDWETLTKFWLI